MNFVMPSLGNATENMTLSDKWASNLKEDTGATALAVLASFTAMVVGAACMLCFVGKLLSKWYTVDIRLNAADTSGTKYEEVGTRHTSCDRSDNYGEAACDVGLSMKMQPIGSSLPKGSMFEYARLFRKLRCITAKILQYFWGLKN